MKKLFLFVLVALCTTGLYAKKQVVYVEYFSYSNSVGDERAEQVRAALISALTTYQHLQVVDVASQSSLSHEKNRRSDEDALEDETARNEKLKQLGANYIVQGYVSSLEITENRKVNKKGEIKLHYDAVMSYSVKVIDCENGTLLSTDLFTYNEDDDNPEECVQDMLKKLPRDVKNIVTKDFKLRSIILDSDYEAKNGNLQKCYINLGEDDGLAQGTVFAVKKAIIKVGRVSWTTIGEIAVESIVAGDLALCKVKKGSKEINAALEEVISIKDSDPNNAHDLIVESIAFPQKSR